MEIVITVEIFVSAETASCEILKLSNLSQQKIFCGKLYADL